MKPLVTDPQVVSLLRSTEQRDLTSLLYNTFYLDIRYEISVYPGSGSKYFPVGTMVFLSERIVRDNHLPKVTLAMVVRNNSTAEITDVILVEDRFHSPVTLIANVSYKDLLAVYHPYYKLVGLESNYSNFKLLQDRVSAITTSSKYRIKQKNSVNPADLSINYSMLDKTIVTNINHYSFTRLSSLYKMLPKFVDDYIHNDGVSFVTTKLRRLWDKMFELKSTLQQNSHDIALYDSVICEIEGGTIHKSLSGCAYVLGKVLTKKTSGSYLIKYVDPYFGEYTTSMIPSRKVWRNDKEYGKYTSSMDLFIKHVNETTRILSQIRIASDWSVIDHHISKREYYTGLYVEFVAPFRGFGAVSLYRSNTRKGKGAVYVKIGNVSMLSAKWFYNYLELVATNSEKCIQKAISTIDNFDSITVPEIILKSGQQVIARQTIPLAYGPNQHETSDIPVHQESRN